MLPAPFPVAVWWSQGCEANEDVSGDGAVRNGPLFGDGLSAALEMRDAYRSFQLEAFCVVRAAGRLRASARIKGSFSALLTAPYGSTPVVKTAGWGE